MEEQTRTEPGPGRARLTRLAKLAALLGIGGLLAVVLGGVVVFKSSSTAAFCRSCHIMEPFYQSWQRSRHKDVECVECHLPVTVSSKILVKLQTISQLTKYITRTYGTRAWARVADANCLREGCHTPDKLALADRAKRRTAFTHARHLGPDVRIGKLRCSTCHMQIDRAVHLETVKQACTTCHFRRGAGKNPAPVECSVCHPAPPAACSAPASAPGPAAKPACEGCHTGAVSGEGEANLQHCRICHNRRSIRETMTDVARIHSIHVTTTGVHCLDCHDQIVHLPGRPRPAAGGVRAGAAARIDHAVSLARKESCIDCHDDARLGPSRVDRAKFVQTRHYKAMLSRGVAKPDDACLSCHVTTTGTFSANPSDNWWDGGGDIEKVSNDTTGTCGKCHEEISKRFARSLHATKKAVYYCLRDLPAPGVEKAFGAGAFEMYRRSCATCHASCSSCHLVGSDGQAIDWKYVMAHAQTVVGTRTVPIARGVTTQAKILALGPNRNPKAGGPLYRNLARQGLVPIETVKLDIESHDFVVPGRLDASRANDVCYRCHENSGRELYGIGLDASYGYSVHARAGMRCVDCHRDQEVHGSGSPELHITKALKVRCETCHTPGQSTAPVDATRAAAAPKVSVTGAHRNVHCSACHAQFYGSCTACHRGPRAQYLETDANTGRPLVYFGRSVEGKVRIVTTTPRRSLPQGSAEDGGIWMMQSRHSIKRSVYRTCEECHADAVKMGVAPLDRPILNTWEMASMGVPKAFVRPAEHLARVKGAPGSTCVSCHAPKKTNRTAEYHGAVLK